MRSHATAVLDRLKSPLPELAEALELFAQTAAKWRPARPSGAKYWFQRVDSNHDKRNQKPQGASATVSNEQDSRAIATSDDDVRCSSMTSPPLAAATSSGPDAVDVALAKALEAATGDGRWDVVSQLARELEARRLARGNGVVDLAAERRRRGT
jgi:hypothetical protein